MAKVFAVQRLGDFFHRFRFAGKHRFQNAQVDGFDQAAVGGIASPASSWMNRPVPAGELHGQQFSAAAHFDPGHGHLLQGRHGLFSLVFLGEAQDGVQDHDDQDDDGVDVLVQEDRNAGCNDQNQHHDLGELLPKIFQGLFTPRSINSLGPYFSSRCSASAGSNPD